MNLLTRINKMILRALDISIRRTGDAGFIAAILIMVFLTASITWEVVSRYILGSSTVWVTEVSGYLVSGVLFMAIGKVYRDNGHVAMSIIVDKFPEHTHARFMMVVDFMVLIFAIFVTWSTYDMAMLSLELGWKSSTTLAVPLYIPQIMIPLGSAILVVEAIRMMIVRTGSLK